MLCQIKKKLLLLFSIKNHSIVTLIFLARGLLHAYINMTQLGYLFLARFFRGQGSLLWSKGSFFYLFFFYFFNNIFTNNSRKHIYHISNSLKLVLNFHLNIKIDFKISHLLTWYRNNLLIIFYSFGYKILFNFTVYIYFSFQWC